MKYEKRQQTLELCTELIKTTKQITVGQIISLAARFQQDYGTVEIPGAGALLKGKKWKSVRARSWIIVQSCIKCRKLGLQMAPGHMTPPLTTHN